MADDLQVESQDAQGSKIRPSPAAQITRVHPDRGVDPRAVVRGQYGDLLGGGLDHVAPATLCSTGPADAHRIHTGDVSPFPKGWIRALGEHSDSFSAISGFGADAESNVAAATPLTGCSAPGRWRTRSTRWYSIRYWAASSPGRRKSPARDLVAVLKYGYWQQRFGQDPYVIGQTIRIDGISRRIVGVMPAGVRFPYADTEFVIPVAFKGGDCIDPWRNFDL